MLLFADVLVVHSIALCSALNALYVPSMNYLLLLDTLGPRTVCD